MNQIKSETDKKIQIIWDKSDTKLRNSVKKTEIWRESISGSNQYIKKNRNWIPFKQTYFREHEPDPILKIPLVKKNLTRTKSEQNKNIPKNLKWIRSRQNNFLGHESDLNLNFLFKKIAIRPERNLTPREIFYWSLTQSEQS